METLFKIFLEQGWLGMIGILICTFIFFGAKYLLNKMNKNMNSGFEQLGKTLITEMHEQNKHLINTILDQQNKIIDHIIDNNINEQKKHNTALTERMELTEDIKNTLKDIGQIHNCQRVFIVEFHNSYQNLSGTPFAKFSCTYEWIDKGVKSIQLEIKDLQFGILSTVVRKVYQSHTQQIVYYDIKEFIKDCPALGKFFKECAAETMVCTAMYDRDNRMIGGLVLEYDYKPENINLIQLHIQAAELTSMLNLRYKYIK